MSTRARMDTRGVVYAEFLLSFMFFFTLFVSVVQLSVVASARLVVQHAAVQAARAAIVTIDDDPVFYEDESRRKHLETKGSGDRSDKTGKALALVAKGAGFTPSGLGTRGSARLSRIRNAAYLPLSAISPTAEQVARWMPFATSLNPGLATRSIAADIDDNPAMRMVVGFGVYSRIGSAITFPVKPGAKELRNANDATFEDRETVTVRVTYLLPCNVPLARDLVCDSVVSVTGVPDALHASARAIAEPSISSFESAYKSWKEAPGAMRNLKQSMKELARAEWAMLQVALYARLSERFIMLQGEAALPNHGAPYKYYSELKGERNKS